MMPIQIRRIAAVTAGLIAAGAVAGGVVGGIMYTALTLAWGGALFSDGPELQPVSVDVGLFLFGLSRGAVVGAVLGPLAAWLLMRHVPLWLAIGGTALGTLGGAAAGLHAGGPEQAFAYAVCGFALSAGALWIFAPLPAGPAA